MIEGRRKCPLPRIFYTLDRKMSTSSASCALFFAVTYFTSKNTASGLTNLPAACTAKGGKTRLLKTLF